MNIYRGWQRSPISNEPHHCTSDRYIAAQIHTTIHEPRFLCIRYGNGKLQKSCSLWGSFHDVPPHGFHDYQTRLLAHLSRQPWAPGWPSQLLMGLRILAPREASCAHVYRVDEGALSSKKPSIVSLGSYQLLLI